MDLKNSSAFRYFDFTCAIVTLLASLTILLTPVKVFSLETKMNASLREHYNHIVGKLSQNLESRSNTQNLIVFEDGSVWGLEELRRQLQSVEVLTSEAPIAVMGSSDVGCVDNTMSTWVTAHDSSSGQPTIFLRIVNGSIDIGLKSEFLIHEAISALGIVDDEYQVSTLLLLAMDGGQNKEFQITDVKKRTSAPQFDLGSSSSCFQYSLSKPTNSVQIKQLSGFTLNQAGKVQILSARNGTGVGGGGHPWASFLKKQMIERSESWWKKYRLNTRKNKEELQQEYQEFRSRLLNLGIEQIPSMAGDAKRLLPITYAFAQSKRTDHCTVYLFLNQAETHQEMWNPIYELVYRKVYYRDQMNQDVVLSKASSAELTVMQFEVYLGFHPDWKAGDLGLKSFSLDACSTD